MHQVGAVGELAERDEILPTKQGVDRTWNKMPRCLQPVWMRRRLESHHGAPQGQSSSPRGLQTKIEKKISELLQQNVARYSEVFGFEITEKKEVFWLAQDRRTRLGTLEGFSGSKPG